MCVITSSMSIQELIGTRRLSCDGIYPNKYKAALQPTSRDGIWCTSRDGIWCTSRDGIWCTSRDSDQVTIQIIICIYMTKPLSYLHDSCLLILILGIPHTTNLIQNDNRSCICIVEPQYCSVARLLLH